jgi:hypothetical protein
MNRMRQTIVIAALFAAGGCGKGVQKLTAPEFGSASTSTDSTSSGNVPTVSGAGTTTSADSTPGTSRGGGWAGSGH